MKKRIIVVASLIILLCNQITDALPSRQKKIVGLVPMRNEELLIADCLRALAMVTDAIVVLDDASEDSSMAIVKSLQKECNIERIHEKKIWYRDEPGDRNIMLKLGREIGGTHFVVIDADEMLTANLVKNNYLRNLILDLVPGDKMNMHWIRLWKKIDQFRTDGLLKEVIFCDDGKSSYQSGFIHTSRIPNNLIDGKNLYIKPYFTYGLLHYQAVNWRNMEIRRAWYRCIIRVRKPEYTDAQVNASCACHEDENNITLAQCPAEWFDGYSFFNPAVYEANDIWREKQVITWLKTYGKGFFKGLDMWHIDWHEELV